MSTEEKLSLYTDTILGLRILLDHAASHCTCDECKAIREKYKMDNRCSMEKFELNLQK